MKERLTTIETQFTMGETRGESMKRASIALLAVACVAAAAVWQQASAQQKESDVAHGKYLVTVGGCNDCHTPWKMGAKGPEPDMSRMLSGHPASIGRIQAPQGEFGLWIAHTTATMTALRPISISVRSATVMAPRRSG